MTNSKTQDVRITPAAHSWLRILIASYFIAAALGLINGTDFTALFAFIAPTETASVIAVGCVFSLAYLVMIGCLTRVAALLLGLITLFSSFVSFFAPDAAGTLAHFWRDLALVAALLLTYPKRRAPVALADTPTAPAAPAAPVAEFRRNRRAAPGTARSSDVRAPLEADAIDNIFYELAETR